MLNDIFIGNTEAKPSPHREGELYKTVSLYGHTFELYYGYYEECDRENSVIDPMPIYPDFLKEPKFTSQGFPLVTKMQDACIYYIGKQTSDRDCAECRYYKHGDDLLGVCTCPENNRLSVATKESTNSTT